MWNIRIMKSSSIIEFFTIYELEHLKKSSIHQVALSTLFFFYSLDERYTTDINMDQVQCTFSLLQQSQHQPLFQFFFTNILVSSLVYDFVLLVYSSRNNVFNSLPTSLFIFITFIPMRWNLFLNPVSFIVLIKTSIYNFLFLIPSSTWAVCSPQDLNVNISTAMNFLLQTDILHSHEKNYSSVVNTFLYISRIHRTKT